LQLRSDLLKRRKTWATTAPLPPNPTPVEDAGTSVTLTPLQIRTFLCNVLSGNNDQ